MPKIKTHRGAAKRFKRTKSGKFLRGKAFKQHILSSKTRKRKRNLKGTTTVAAVDQHKLAKMLPWYARPENPIDPTGTNAGNEEMYVKCIEILAAEPHLDVILVSQDSPAAFDLPVAKATVEAAKRTDKCIVFFNNFSGPWNPEIVQMLRAEAGTVPSTARIEGSLAIRPCIVNPATTLTEVDALAACGWFAKNAP